MKIICQNKKASHDYFLLDTFEAGIKLKGTEIKSIREGKTNINDAYVIVKNSKVFIISVLFAVELECKNSLHNKHFVSSL